MAKSSAEIVTKARQVDELAAEVASASKEQTQGIEQVNIAVSQMDKVTQSNAASAEESASAAQELNAQSESLKGSVADLLRMVNGQDLVEQRQSKPVEQRPVKPTGAAWLPMPAPRKGGKGHRPAAPARQTTPVPILAEKDGPALIQWDEARMTTGVAEIDEQHQELFSMINRLHRACVAGAGKAEVRQMLDFLAAYVQTHFSHEEQVMEQHRCPAMDSNKLAHAKFLKTFQKLVATFEAKGSSTTVLLDLQRLVADWLRNHICSVDTGLRQCVSKSSGSGRMTHVLR